VNPENKMHPTKRTAAIAIVVSLISVFGSHAFAAEPPPLISISLDGGVVHVSGLTEGGSAVVAVAWKIRMDGWIDVQRTSRAVDANAEGLASVDFDSVPPGAFIGVIDISSGRLATHLTEPIRFEREEFPVSRLGRNAARDVEEITSPHEHALVVVVRPGVGAWEHIAGDGGSDDADGIVNGHVRTTPALMRRIGNSPPAPQKITPRDVVLFVDPWDRVYASTEVTP
jgi:hypothetical protein